MPSVVPVAAAGVGCQLPRDRSQFLIGAAAAAAAGTEVWVPGSAPGSGPGSIHETSAPQPWQTGKVCLRNLPVQLVQYGLCKQPAGVYVLLAAIPATARSSAPMPTTRLHPIHKGPAGVPVAAESGLESLA